MDIIVWYYKTNGFVWRSPRNASSSDWWLALISQNWDLFPRCTILRTSFIFHVWIFGLPWSPLAAMLQCFLSVLALHLGNDMQDAGHLPWKIYTPSVKHVKQCNAKIIQVPKFFSWVFLFLYLFIVIFHCHLQLAHRCSEKSPDLLLTSRKANPDRFYACAWPSITMTDGPCTMLGMFLFLGMVIRTQNLLTSSNITKRMGWQHIPSGSLR